MNRVIDVVIPTLRKQHAMTCLALLRHIPWPINLLLIPEGRNWSEAVNLGLSEVRGNDVVLMDDDVFLWPETFRDLNYYLDRADIFGFKLLYPDKRIQHAGGVYKDSEILHIGNGQPDGAEFNEAKYVCHVTTSLCYIKNHVIKALGGMATDYKGIQFEDVDFNMRALKAGFKILYTGFPATHLESASKRYLPNFTAKMHENQDETKRRFFGDRSFIKMLEGYPQAV